MTEKLTGKVERRVKPRFSLKVPLTVFIGDRGLSAYTKDVSNRGVYFYLPTADSGLIDRDFEFQLHLPPEVTLSTWCSIHCRGRLVRKEVTIMDLTGVAAEILQYSILREAVNTA
jgi:PilZ domain